jgi:hypothetical protein
MRTASVLLALCLAVALLLGALAQDACADRRSSDDTAMTDVSDGAAPLPAIWRTSRVVDSVVLAGQRLRQSFGAAPRQPAPLLSSSSQLRDARVDRSPTRRRAVLRPRLARP